MTLSEFLAVSVALVILCFTLTSSEPTTVKYTYNSSDLSFLSIGIQFPARSCVSLGYMASYEDDERVGELKWFSGLYDQHRWLNRIGKLENQHCRTDMEIYIRNLHNGTSWATKSNVKY